MLSRLSNQWQKDELFPKKIIYTGKQNAIQNDTSSTTWGGQWFLLSLKNKIFKRKNSLKLFQTDLQVQKAQ